MPTKQIDFIMEINPKFYTQHYIELDKLINDPNFDFNYLDIKTKHRQNNQYKLSFIGNKTEFIKKLQSIFKNSNLLIEPPIKDDSHQLDLLTPYLPSNPNGLLLNLDMISDIIDHTQIAEKINEFAFNDKWSVQKEYKSNSIITVHSIYDSKPLFDVKFKSATASATAKPNNNNYNFNVKSSSMSLQNMYNQIASMKNAMMSVSSAIQPTTQSITKVNTSINNNIKDLQKSRLEVQMNSLISYGKQHQLEHLNTNPNKYGNMPIVKNLILKSWIKHFNTYYKKDTDFDLELYVKTNIDENVIITKDSEFRIYYIENGNPTFTQKKFLNYLQNAECAKGLQNTLKQISTQLSDTDAEPIIKENAKTYKKLGFTYIIVKIPIKHHKSNP